MSSSPRNNPPRVLRALEAQNGRQSKVLQIQGQIPAGTSAIGRLQYVWQTFPFDPEIVSQSMRFKSNGLFFCDSTVFLAPTSSSIWAAMTHRNEIALIPRILGEISAWIKDEPSTNSEAHARVNACLSGDTESKVRIITEPIQKWISKSVWYYADLLGVRKLMWHIAKGDLGKRLNREPTGQEISNFIQQFGNSRAQLLAKQGRNPKVLDNLYNDEWLVATAIIYAIATGTEVTLVSGDEAVLDQFAKATVILTRHYETMHFANRFAQSPRCFDVETIQNPTEDFFQGPEIDLVRSPFSVRRGVLPPNHHPIQVHCMLLQRNVTRCTFQADQEMADVLRTKFVTNGLCSDQLCGRNLHLDSPGIIQAAHGDVATVATDVTINAGGTIPVSFTDIEHSLNNSEEVIDIKWVDPKILLLPPKYWEA